ncbi:hypothetical protein [uncultured Massilia sp.]|uniref:hypothetical protein n=1 Tax=uncultured Massilia sp. TaxID=169973 RepID=UPI0026015352|nr:hypothetical protein [uncultured Massilia sp.]
MDPINYSQLLPSIDLGQSLLSGLQAGAALAEIQQQRGARDLAQQQSQQYENDIAAAMLNPTPQAFSALALKYPKQREAIKQSWDGMSAAEQKAEGDTYAQVASALQAGRKDLARKVLQAQIDALKNSGVDASHYENGLDIVTNDPKKALGYSYFVLSHVNDPRNFAQTFGTLQTEQRTADLAPAALRKANADAGSAEADEYLKNRSIVAQTAGSLAKPGVKLTQAQTMFRTLAAKGIIPQDELQGYLDGIPTDAAALPGYLRQVQAQGLSAADQTKYTTPTADAQLQAETSRANTAANVAGQLAVQDRIAARQEAAAKVKVEHGIAGLTDEQNEALFGANGAVTTGRLDPNRVNSKTASIFAAAELKNPGTDFARISSDVARDRRANTEFATGKAGNSIRSFNVGISHLDTLGQLADALGNKDTQAVNRIGNYFAMQTGLAAPTNFQGAKKIVGDEIVKAIVGAGGGVADREEAGRIIDAANSPAQLKGAIKTVQELMVGQLGGLEQQYRTTTGRSDFDKYLSPRAIEIRRSHDGSVHAAPSGGGHPSDIDALLKKYGGK